MTKAKISEYDAVAANNTDVNGVNIAEGCPPSGMNNMGREIMAALKRFQTGADGDSVTVGGSLVVSNTLTAGPVSATTLNTSGAVVFNDAGADVDFRVEGDTDANLLFVDASTDKVGIGASPSEKLSVSSNGTAQISITNSSGTTKNTQLMFKDNVGSKWRIGMDVATNNNTNIFQIYNDVATAAAMSIDSSGNVGIARTPSYRLDMSSPSGIGLRIIETTTGNSGRFQAGVDSGLAFIDADASSGSIALGFKVSNTERMRIDSSGNLLVGTTSNPVYGSTEARLNILKASGQYVINSTVSATTPEGHIAFRNPNGVVGNITTNASATSYNTSSDYRLKENIAPMTGALAKVLELNPVTYTWKIDGSAGEGFIAHELQEVVPHAVSGEKDGEEMQGVDYGRITPLLTAALQEALAKIQTLEARIAALETK